MIKRVITLFLVMVVCLSVFAGCQGNAGNSGEQTTAAQTTIQTQSEVQQSTAPAQTEPVEVSFTSGGGPVERELWTKMENDFMSKNPDIKIKDVFISGDQWQKTFTMLSAGNAPDVIQIDSGVFGSWVKTGALSPIQPYINEENYDLSDYWPALITMFSYDGKLRGKGDLYCLPKDMGTYAMVYNKDLFTKAGLPFPDPKKPMTFDEFLTAAQKLTIKDGNKITQYGCGPIWPESFVWSNGGDFLSPDHKEFTGNQPDAVEALQFIADLRGKYKVSPDNAALQAMNDAQMFETGKIAMYFAGRWMVPQYRQLKFDWDVCPVPVGKTGVSAYWCATVGYGMPKTTKHPKEAYRFIKYLGGDDGARAMNTLGYAIPFKKSLARTDEFLDKGQKPEHMDVFVDSADNSRPIYSTLMTDNKWWDIYNQKIGQIYEGKKTVQQILDEMKPEIDKALKEGNPELFN